MLNELLVLERGLARAGFSIVGFHPDVVSPGKHDALHIRLDTSGEPIEAALLSGDRVAALRTLRNGKQNSFPFIQMKQPLLSTPRGDPWRSTWDGKWKKSSSLGDKRELLKALAQDFRPRIRIGAAGQGRA